MNNLSWLLYLADVLPNAASMIGGACMLIMVLGGFGMIIWTTSYMSEDAPKPTVGWCFYSLVVVVGVLTLAVPTKSTFYLIAGSEAGEAVITSPEGAEILKDIKVIIKQQINGAMK